jgi:hypothetical protein
MLEHILQNLPAYLATAVGALLAELMRRVLKKLGHASESLVRGNLAFHEVAERKPEYQAMFEAWKGAGDISVRTKTAAAGK